MSSGVGDVSFESYSSVDVRKWAREGRLEHGHCFSEERLDARGRRVDWFGIQIFLDRVSLHYIVRQWPGGLLKRKDTQIRLASTACHYGGRRHWLRCPGQHCRRRVAKLYLKGGRFACRQCVGLKYKKLQLSPWRRGFKVPSEFRITQRKVQVLPAVSLPKPKGMHWTTYGKLRTKGDLRNQ